MSFVTRGITTDTTDLDGFGCVDRPKRANGALSPFLLSKWELAYERAAIRLLMTIGGD